MKGIRRTDYGYGIWVVLDDQNGVVSYYAHLNDVTTSPGNTVFVNNQIGDSGCTGNCSGSHVHVTWCKNPTFDTDGQPYNGTAEPQSPLYTYNGSYPVYNSPYAGEVVHGH